MNAASFARAPDSMHFHGIPIVTSPLLPFERTRRTLKPKRWHRCSPGYVNRVGKKWRKRFGTEQVNAIMVSDRCFVSAAVAAQLRRAKS